MSVWVVQSCARSTGIEGDEVQSTPDKIPSNCDCTSAVVASKMDIGR